MSYLDVVVNISILEKPYFLTDTLLFSASLEV